MDILSQIKSSNFSHFQLVLLESLRHGGALIQATVEDIGRDNSSEILDLDRNSALSDAFFKTWKISSFWNGPEDSSFQGFGNKFDGAAKTAESLQNDEKIQLKFGANSLSRSSSLGFGPLLMSLVIAAVLCAGMFNYMSASSPQRVLTSYAAEKEILDGIAQQVWEDVLHDKEEGDSKSNKFSRKTGVPIPYPVPVRVGPLSRVFSTDGRPSRTLEGKMRTMETLVMMPAHQTRKINRRKGALKSTGHQESFRRLPKTVLKNFCNDFLTSNERLKSSKSRYMPQHMNKTLLGRRGQLIQGDRNPIIILKPDTVFQSSRVSTAPELWQKKVSRSSPSKGKVKPHETLNDGNPIILLKPEPVLHPSTVLEPLETSQKKVSRSSVNEGKFQQHGTLSRDDNHWILKNKEDKLVAHSKGSAKSDKGSAGKATSLLQKQSVPLRTLRKSPNDWSEISEIPKRDFFRHHHPANFHQTKDKYVLKNRSYFEKSNPELTFAGLGEDNSNEYLDGPSDVITQYHNPTLENDNFKLAKGEEKSGNRNP